MNETITTVDLPVQYAVVVRTKTGPQAVGEDMGRSFHQVMTYLQTHALWPPAGPAICFYFEIASETDWTIGGGFPVVDNTLELEEPFELVEAPAGRYATLLHTGPYSGLSASWKLLEEWYTAQGYTIDMTNMWCWESYLTDPSTEPDESKYQTQLFWKI